MAISESPWTFKWTKTAAKMTAVMLKGQQIFKGKRAKGQSNPSPQYLQSQAVSAFAWAMFDEIQTYIQTWFEPFLQKQSGANAWYKANYNAIIGTGTAPDIDPARAQILITRGPISTTSLSAGITADVSDDKLKVYQNTGVYDETQSTDDIQRVLAWNITLGQWFFGQTPGRANWSTAEYDLPAGWNAGHSLAVYYFTVGGATGLYPNKSSNSLAALVTIVA